MISTAALNEISNIVGKHNLIRNRKDLTEYSSDGTKLQYMPDAVAFPANDKEISKIFLLANKEYFPIIPRGGGSGMSGGSLPVKGGLVLAMDRLNRIIEIDRDNLTAKVEPCVITARFQEEVEKLDLFYPPDPASADVSTLGGNVAECAGGLRGLKYGVTRDYVLGLTVVLPNGEIIKTGVETFKGVAGYDLTRLIVGSEGTLAVITSITVKLIPRPASKITMTACFSDLDSTVRTVSNIIRNKVVPSTLEFLDKLSIDCVRNHMNLNIPEGTGAMLLIEVDGDKGLTENESKKVKDICDRSGAIDFKIAFDEKEIENLWKARREVSPSLLQLRPAKISEDIVVPRSRMPELVSFLGDLSNTYGLPIPAFGHAGDGNIHVNIMLDNDNPDEREKAEKIVKELFKKVMELGGTISGEHGIGITKAPYMEIEFSRPAIELMRRIKESFDPHNILNPGKIFNEL
jgi:glycolate oxidase